MLSSSMIRMDLEFKKMKKVTFIVMIRKDISMLWTRMENPSLLTKMGIEYKEISTAELHSMMTKIYLSLLMNKQDNIKNTMSKVYW